MKNLIQALTRQKQPLICSEILKDLGCSLEHLICMASPQTQVFVQGDELWICPRNQVDSALLSWLCSEEILWFDEVNSTNSVAAQLCSQRDFSGVVVAGHQTSGRGRLQRTWHSTAHQNILMSMVFKPANLAPTQAARTTLLWSAALADELDLRVKWPNDILDNQGRKVAGLLAELALEGNRVQHIVLGIGLNVNQDQFPQDIPNPSSLKLVFNREFERADLIRRIVQRLRAVDLHASLDLWRSKSIMTGKRVVVQGKVGVLERIREDGALIVDGEVILAGDVALL